MLLGTSSSLSTLRAPCATSKRQQQHSRKNNTQLPNTFARHNSRAHVPPPAYTQAPPRAQHPRRPIYPANPLTQRDVDPRRTGEHVIPQTACGVVQPCPWLPPAEATARECPPRQEAAPHHSRASRVRSVAMPPNHAVAATSSMSSISHGSATAPTLLEGIRFAQRHGGLVHAAAVAVESHCKGMGWRALAVSSCVRSAGCNRGRAALLAATTPSGTPMGGASQWARGLPGATRPGPRGCSKVVPGGCRG